MKSFYFIFILCYSFSLVWGQETPLQSWMPNLTSEEQRLNFLVNLRGCYPFLAKGNNTYQRDQLEILREIEEVNKLLGPNGESLAIKPSKVFGVEYAVGVQWSYSPQTMEEVQQVLKRSLKRLQATGCLVEENVQSYLPFKKCLIQGEKKLKHNTIEMDFLKLWPILISHKGSERESFAEVLKKQIDQMTHDQLKKYYEDELINSLEKSLDALKVVKGFKSLPEMFQGIKNKFIDRLVKKALTPMVNGKVNSHLISLEEVPAILASYRGYMADDCSMISIPHYTLIKGQKTYLVRRKQGDRVNGVEGFVSVFPIEYGGQIIPYIGTINGPNLTEEDTRWIMELVAKEWGSDEIYVPSSTRRLNRFLANTEAINQTWKFPGIGAETISPPKGWEELEQWHNNLVTKGRGQQYYNYFTKKNFSRVKKISMPLKKESQAVNFFSLAPELRCLPQSNGLEDLQGFSLWQRAKTLNRIFKDSRVNIPADKGMQNKILNLLSVSESNFELINKFFGMIDDPLMATMMSSNDLISLMESFQINIIDLTSEMMKSSYYDKEEMILKMVNKLFLEKPLYYNSWQWLSYFRQLNQENERTYLKQVQKKTIDISNINELGILTRYLHYEVLQNGVTYDWKSLNKVFQNFLALKNTESSELVSNENNQRAFLMKILLSKSLPTGFLQEIPFLIGHWNNFSENMKYEFKHKFMVPPPYSQPASVQDKLGMLNFIQSLFTTTAFPYLLSFLQDHEAEVQLEAFKIFLEAKYSEDDFKDYSYQFTPINEYHHHFQQAAAQLLSSPLKSKFLPLLKELISAYPKNFGDWASYINDTESTICVPPSTSE